MTAREAALRALSERRRSGVRLDAALDGAVRGLDTRDAALAARLCYGVTQNAALIDVELSKRVKKTQPQVWDILRLGAYQIWRLDRVPRHAVTDEAVRLCKKTAPHAAGMVNAVLRAWPDAPPEVADPSVRHSLPEWFCEKMDTILPEDEREAFFESCNAIPPVYIQRNTLRPKGEVPGRPHPLAPECYILEDAGPLGGLLKRGWGIVADPAAKLCVEALAPRAGMKVWDACAAPGGKTLMSAFAMENKGRILATDRAAGKLPLIWESLKRCGVTNTDVKETDAAVFLPEGQFDAVLCDVPCSGFGVLRKKPDIRYRTDTARFPPIQLAILRNASRAVGDGGTLLYCTCTVLTEENEGVVRAFLNGGGAFEIGEMTTLWPHKGDTDGFFICKMIKR